MIDLKWRSEKWVKQLEVGRANVVFHGENSKLREEKTR